jgi:methyltransferase FkbM-like protein
MSIPRLKKMIKSILPKTLVATWIARLDDARQRKFLDKLKLDIVSYCQQQSVLSGEEKEVLDYLEDHPVTIFPYDFKKKYDKELIAVLSDQSNGLRYVLHDGKRLYFKRSLGEYQIKGLYHGLLLDQDGSSPHLYLTEDFNLSADDVIADIGAAEGNFSLSNVDKVKKIHLFESDPEWIEALTATFKPWNDKVFIHNKFVSNSNSANSISIDSFAKEHHDISFFKVDIEGEEANFLDGAKNYLTSRPRLKIAICTYHKAGDEVEFTTTLQNHHFKVSPSNRYMIFYHDPGIKAPFLRRGLLRAQKTEKNA